ncbi:MAG: nitroreductase family deazaflavin-dependent oxidoreductase, partial [Chloroflexi bacterium]
FQEMCKIWPSYADYQTRTERVIPVVVLERQPSH